MIYTVQLPNLYYNKKEDTICFHSRPPYRLSKTYYPLPQQIFKGNQDVLGYSIKFDVIRYTSDRGLQVKISVPSDPENDISIISKVVEGQISNITFRQNEILLMNNDSFYEEPYIEEEEVHDNTNEQEEVESVYSDWDTFN